MLFTSIVLYKLFLISEEGLKSELHIEPSFVLICKNIGLFYINYNYTLSPYPCAHNEKKILWWSSHETWRNHYNNFPARTIVTTLHHFCALIRTEAHDLWWNWFSTKSRYIFLCNDQGMISCSFHRLSMHTMAKSSISMFCALIITKVQLLTTPTIHTLIYSHSKLS